MNPKLNEYFQNEYSQHSKNKKNSPKSTLNNCCAGKVLKFCTLKKPALPENFNALTYKEEIRKIQDNYNQSVAILRGDQTENRKTTPTHFLKTNTSILHPEELKKIGRTEKKLISLRIPHHYLRSTDNPNEKIAKITHQANAISGNLFTFLELNPKNKKYQLILEDKSEKKGHSVGIAKRKENYVFYDPDLDKPIILNNTQDLCHWFNNLLIMRTGSGVTYTQLHIQRYPKLKIKKN